MDSVFTIKKTKSSINLLAFQYDTITYSIEILKRRKKELQMDPILKNKINNYIMMERLAIEQDLKKEQLPFDIKKNAKDYLNSPNNTDLKNYMSICKHIVAKQLDIKEICSRVDFHNHYFKVSGQDLICLDYPFSTIGSNYNEIEKKFLCACARMNRRIVDDNITSGGTQPFYSSFKDIETNNLVSVI